MQEPNENGQLSSEELAKLLASIEAGEKVNEGRVGGTKFRQIDWTEKIDPAKASQIQLIITNPAGELEEMSLVEWANKIDEEQDLSPINESIKSNKLDARDDVNQLRFESALEESFDGELEEALSAVDAYVYSTFEPTSDFFVAPVSEEPGTAPIYTVGDYALDAERTTLSINGIDVIKEHTNFMVSEELGYSKYINGADQMALLEGDTAEVKGYGVVIKDALNGYEDIKDRAAEVIKKIDDQIAAANQFEEDAKTAYEVKIAEVTESLKAAKEAKADAESAYDKVRNEMDNAESENDLEAAYKAAVEAQATVESASFEVIDHSIEFAARQEARTIAKKAYQTHVDGLQKNKSEAEDEKAEATELLATWKQFGDGKPGKELA